MINPTLSNALLGCLFFTDLLIMKLAIDNNREKRHEIAHEIATDSQP